MSQQGRPLELGEYYLPSNLLLSQALDCIDLDSPPARLGEHVSYDDDHNTYDNSSEDGTTYGEESLHPLPLDLEEGRRRTGTQQARHLMLYLQSSSTATADNQIHIDDQELINFDPKNKPLPLSPMEEEKVDPSSRYSASVYPERDCRYLGHIVKRSFKPRRIKNADYKKQEKEKKSKINSRRVLGCGKIGKYVVPPKSASAYSPNSRQLAIELEKIKELKQQRLLQSFFGLDRELQLHSLNNATMRDIQHFLNDRPQPDSVINKQIHPLVCCAWLRNFIVDSLHTLDVDRYFDRGRLLGLQLKDESTQNVHRGFGLLWGFLKACGPSVSYEACTVGWRMDNDKASELGWFQHCKVSPADTEHMLQIWNALKLLLLQHSAERHGRWHGDRDAVNVNDFMKHGLGGIQEYLAGVHKMKKLFRDGSEADTFFTEACREWQGRWTLE